MAGGACPQCGSRQLRVSKLRGPGERLATIVGIYPLRCRQCSHRYSTAIWNHFALRYARCPKCLRRDLSTWSEQYYNPSRWTLFKLRMGATPYRCEFCRCNFVSFRSCKEKFSWRRGRAQEN